MLLRLLRGCSPARHARRELYIDARTQNLVTGTEYQRIWLVLRRP
jgi:hypothetical protein